MSTMVHGALIGVAAAVTLTTAPPALADNPGMYLQRLDSARIHYHDSQSALTMGYAVCKSLEVGANPTQIQGVLVAAMYSPQAAWGGIMQASVDTLCPPQDTQIWNSWLATYQAGSPPPPPGPGAGAALQRLQQAAEAASEP